METNVNYTLVGAFVIVLTAAIVLAVIWMSSGFNFEGHTEYLIHMQESVSGITTESPVEYNGVHVGTVKSVELDPNNPHLVTILITIKSSTPITQGTVATLASRGITGLTFIALKDKSTNRRPLKRLPGEKYAVIPTAPSLFTRIDTAMSQLSSSFQKMSDSIQKLLDQENLTSIKNSLHHISLVTDRLEQQTLPAVYRSMSHFNQLSRTLEIQTLPAVYRSLLNLNDVTSNLNTIAKDLKQDPSVLIRGRSPLPPGPGERR